MNERNLHLLLQNCISLEKLQLVHGLAVKFGLLKLQHLACKILNSYAKLNEPLEAQKVFCQIGNPDIVSRTSLLSLYLQIDNPNRAFSVFVDIIVSGLRPDSFSIVGAVSACGRNRDLVNGKAVHGMVLRYEVGTDTIVGNALIDMYSRNGKIEVAKRAFRGMELKDVSSWTSLLNGFILCNDLDSAHHLFDKMTQRNSIAWTALITGYVRSKNPVQALKLFRQMNSEGKDQPTAITIVAVLSGCADSGALDLGRCIHGYINKSNFIHNVTVKNTLIDMYSKSGNLAFAIMIFTQMTERDLFSWTTMISSFALHGKGVSALEIFTQMLELGITPNEVTFVSVLSACSHAGLVSDGQKLFRKMIEYYGCKPKIEHYGCMVDLLCRGGGLEEAKELINQMSIKPDGVIWRSLLSACLVHGNLRFAEMVGKEIIELEPYDDGVYILLWNIYCSKNRWDDALKMRKLMRERKIKKKPGCSWVEINGCVHEFVAEETVGHVGEEIFFVLELVDEQVKFEKNGCLVSQQNVCNSIYL